MMRVIPVKNEEKNLPVCLENVKDSTAVILVDLGSTQIRRIKSLNGRGMREERWVRDCRFQVGREVPEEPETMLSSPDVERYDVIKCYYDN